MTKPSRRIARLLVLAVLAPLVLFQPTSASASSTQRPGDGRRNCGLQSFETAVVHQHGWHLTLVVRGWSDPDDTITLVPLYYDRQPDYWGIDVWKCSRETHPRVSEHYRVALEIHGTVGRRGIEVVGRHQSLRIRVP